MLLRQRGFFRGGYNLLYDRLVVFGILSAAYRQSFSFLVTGATPTLPAVTPTNTIVTSALFSGSTMSDQQEKEQTKDTAYLWSKCACGKSQLQVSVPQQYSENSGDSVTAVDCHCPACRNFHVAAFGSYLYLPSEHVHFGDINALKTYSETCDEIGPVDRLFCRHCFTKMATRPKPYPETEIKGTETEDDDKKKEKKDMLLVNMGGLVDDTIPKEYSKAWQSKRQAWQPDSQAAWTKARPPRKRSSRPLGMPPIERRKTTKGSCACGNCQYEMTHRPEELQHCYCNLCRQFCGSAFMTWIPVYNEDFKWTTNPPPRLRRTTPHGQRHFSEDCGGALTIVYDDQPDMTWPAAGALVDTTLPGTRDELNYCLHRTCHICCTWKQSWYAIPNDGLERIPYAG